MLWKKTILYLDKDEIKSVIDDLSKGTIFVLSKKSLIDGNLPSIGILSKRRDAKDSTEREYWITNSTRRELLFGLNCRLNEYKEKEVPKAKQN